MELKRIFYLLEKWSELEKLREDMKASSSSTYD